MRSDPDVGHCQDIEVFAAAEGLAGVEPTDGLTGTTTGLFPAGLEDLDDGLPGLADAGGLVLATRRGAGGADSRSCCPG